MTCGNGIGTRSRSCSNPTPQHGGHICAGNYSDSILCGQPYCAGTDRSVNSKVSSVDFAIE